MFPATRKQTTRTYLRNSNHSMHNHLHWWAAAEPRNRACPHPEKILIHDCVSHGCFLHFAQAALRLALLGDPHSATRNNDIRGLTEFLSYSLQLSVPLIPSPETAPQLPVDCNDKVTCSTRAQILQHAARAQQNTREPAMDYVQCAVVQSCTESEATSTSTESKIFRYMVAHHIINSSYNRLQLTTVLPSSCSRLCCSTVYHSKAAWCSLV